MVVVNLGLTYDMGHAEMTAGIETLDAIVNDIDGIRKERAVFSSFGDFSLNLEFVYHIDEGEDVFLKQSEVNFEILKRFEEAGLDFAFPSQTLYNVQVPPKPSAAA